ncbi:hypothetical protein CAG61_08300 [Vibrio sp. V34_P3A8T189]|uniref:phage head spike fiber domain-containing protein n=1 Tax=unclassified Vibrio TaxID=2614977 RepID=UPI0013736E3D|nr:MULTISPECIES: hypothetical protein [unclassified Vibrio]NAW78367.1 hypothetical protein [Vibrio sp. V33_P6A3T137]NAX01854.1 hypothetical protein [Vibrio sp. V34_P3A8T189]NAX08267.1 hypothetical protein [Vibrio sp. V40_P2S30T141]
MDWIYLNVSVQNNSKVVTVHNQSTAGVRGGDGLLIPGFGLVQISGVFSGQLELKQPWTNASQQSAQAAIVPTFGDFEGAAKTMRDFTQTTQANFAEMEKWWTQTGTVKFKGQNNVEHTVRTAKQMDADVKAIEQAGNEKLAELEQRADHVYDEVSEAMMTEFNRRKALRESIKQKATLSLDFVNNEHKIYGPLGLEKKPLTDILVTERATAATYQSPFGLRVAGPNTPRIQYDPVSGECLGLLSEQSSVNLVTRSNDLSRGPWWVNPTGSLLREYDEIEGATKITVNSDSPFASLMESFSFPDVDDQLYTLSLKIKLSEKSKFKTLAFGESRGTDSRARWRLGIDAGSGDVVDNFNLLNYKHEYHSDGYHFYSLTILNDGSRTMRLAFTLANTEHQENDECSLLVKEVKFERAALATSAIITDGSAVTRDSDTHRVNEHVNDWIQGTIYLSHVHTSPPSPLRCQHYYLTGKVVARAGVGIATESTGLILRRRVGDSGFQFTSDLLIPISEMKVGETYKSVLTFSKSHNGFRFSVFVNGKQVIKNTTALDFSEVIQDILIGRVTRSDSAQGVSLIKELTAIPLEISDAEAMEITK